MTSATPGDPTTTLHARADVATASPERYAKQLVSHLEHKADVTDGPTSTVQLGSQLVRFGTRSELTVTWQHS